MFDNNVESYCNFSLAFHTINVKAKNSIAFIIWKSIFILMFKLCIKSVGYSGRERGGGGVTSSSSSLEKV